jgi:hypothetical protein
MNECSEHLIYALSAHSEITWTSFKDCTDEILRENLYSGEKTPFLRHRLMRLLDAFGYCDVSFKKGSGTLYVCPASIIRLPVAGVSAILIGARSPSTIEDLARVNEKHQGVTISVEKNEERTLLPSRIKITAESEAELSNYAAALQVPLILIPPAWTLCQLAENIVQYRSSLTWVKGSDIGWHSWEFNPEFCEFRGRTKSERLFRLVRYLSPISNTYRHRLWMGDTFAETEPDWGRYCVLQESGFNVLYYDQANHLFAVPRSAYLPRILQRALGLCSGLPPLVYGGVDKPRDRMVLDLYQSVPKSIACCVSEKVGQSLSFCSLM